MRLMLESTDQVVKYEGVEVRVWKATTETGVECFAFVRALAVRNNFDQSQFEDELRELPDPRTVPLSHVLV